MKETQRLFSLLSNITHGPDSLPPQMFSTAFCNTLLSSFTTKIHKTHQQPTPSSSHDSSSTLPSQSPSQSLSAFVLPSVSDTTDQIQKSKPSTCQLDPLPTSLVKAITLSLFPLSSPSSSILPSPLELLPHPSKQPLSPNTQETWRRSE